MLSAALVLFVIIFPDFAVSLESPGNGFCETGETEGSEQHFRKVSIASCIADCIELEPKQDGCRFDASTGKAVAKFNNVQEDGCPKCAFPFENIESLKPLMRIVTMRNISICGKNISFATAGLPASLSLKYACGFLTFIAFIRPHSILCHCSVESSKFT
ncbi:Hypothetical predicted protein [Cloeon dipterum]|uniref:Uncharacterized protein n=1 Tax=Cloeon dipterum TaxID=197152 RepID=A0A8S1DDG2_9INSE|nr:Hypothetical predicted protein [Cloeon dipterum]